MLVLSVQAQKVFKLNSPNDNLCVKITTGKQLVYDITCNGKQILAPSPISMTLDNGQVWGDVRHGSAGVTGRLCVIGSHLNKAALAGLFGVEWKKK